MHFPHTSYRAQQRLQLYALRPSAAMGIWAISPSPKSIAWLIPLAGPGGELQPGVHAQRSVICVAAVYSGARGAAGVTLITVTGAAHGPHGHVELAPQNEGPVWGAMP